MSLIDRITSGNKEIVNSGTFFLFDNENTCEFIINDDVSTIRLRLQFEETDDKKQSLNSEIDEKSDTMTLHCVNFEESGTGLKYISNIATIKVEKMGEKKDYRLYFTFWANKLNPEKNWRIEYTFYIEEV